MQSRRCGPRRPASRCSCTRTPIRAPARANPGYDPSVLLGPGGADGIVLSCWDSGRGRAAGRPRGRGRAAGGSHRGVAARGRRPGRAAETLGEQAGAVRAAGATELRLYHAGLASASDLAAIGSLRSGPGQAS